jgi:hypothetical protein
MAGFKTNSRNQKTIRKKRIYLELTVIAVFKAILKVLFSGVVAPMVSRGCSPPLF